MVQIGVDRSPTVPLAVQTRWVAVDQVCLPLQLLNRALCDGQLVLQVRDELARVGQLVRSANAAAVGQLWGINAGKRWLTFAELLLLLLFASVAVLNSCTDRMTAPSVTRLRGQAVVPGEPNCCDLIQEW